MSKFSNPFAKALDAVGIMAIIPDAEAAWEIEDNHRFGLGQPLYFKPEHSFDDPCAYIAIEFYKGAFGDWMVKLVSEDDTEGQVYTSPEDHLTDEPPSTIPKVTYIGSGVTGTGVMLHLIEGGFPELNTKASP